MTGAFTKAALGAERWWTGLQSDRAALARLRRAGDVVEALIEPATIQLVRKLGRDEGEKTLSRIAVIAHVLAHVRKPGQDRLIRLLGPGPGEAPENAKLKPVRLRHVLGLREDDELMRGMRRLVQMTGPDRRLDVGHLAASLFFWSDRTRARWAFDYYAAEAWAPGDQESIDNSIIDPASDA